MNCAFDKEKLTGYYDGELGAAEKAEVERHIASCSECLRDLGELKSAALLVRDLPRLRAPESIAEGVSREIQAAGKVHVLTKVRRTVLWASAAAAGLFVVLNVIYFSSKPAVLDSTGASASMARVAAKAEAPPKSDPAPELQGAKDGRGSADMAKRMEDDRAAAPDARRALDKVPADALRRQEKDEAAKPVEELRKADAEQPSRKKVVMADPERGAAKPGAPPAPVPPPAPVARPAEPAAPPAAAVAPKPPAEAPATTARPEPRVDAKPEVKQASELAEKAAAPKVEADPKAKAAALAGPAELPPVLCNVVSTQQTAKSRARVEEALKALGVVLAPPAPQPAKSPRNREAENTVSVELTPSQLARLREELEKPGDTRLVVTSPVDPVLPAFGGGGIFARKDAASGGSKPPQAGKDREAKEAENAAAAKGAADPGATEPRRRVTLHFVESKTLPAGDVEPARKQ